MDACPCSRSCYYTISSYGRATYNSKCDHGELITPSRVLTFLLDVFALFSRITTVLLYKKDNLLYRICSRDSLCVPSRPVLHCSTLRFQLRFRLLLLVFASHPVLYL